MPGIYLSYPFCAQKCTFCNFASGVHSAETERLYFAALLDEISRTLLPFTPDTLYLGGGTPSTLAPELLEALCAALPYSFKEATIEAAPGTLTPERVRCWKRLGIRRVSLGVQSFVTAELRRTGRRHTAATVLADCELLRREGIENFNIDLIAGLPGQTQDSWNESLRLTGQIAPLHVSIYMFEIDEESSLGAEVLLNGKRYGAPDLPSDDLTATFYESAANTLAGQDLARYEISNFARPGAESLHNLKYWQLKPYLGFGAGAHSFDGERRWANPETLTDYLAHPYPSAPEPAGPAEHLWVGLRLTNGIAVSSGELRTHQAPIARLVSQGLLEWSDSLLRLTPRGILLANEVCQEFLPA